MNRRRRPGRRPSSTELAGHAMTEERKAAFATEMAGCLASGRSPKEAASVLGVSERTVQRFAAKEGLVMTEPAPPRRRPVSLGWMDRGSCRSEGPGLFFGPDDEWWVERNARVAKAKVVCASCPVTAECDAYAEKIGADHGVWAGRDERERRELRQDVAA